jgi:hypothetical protein
LSNGPELGTDHLMCNGPEIRKAYLTRKGPKLGTDHPTYNGPSLGTGDGIYHWLGSRLLSCSPGSNPLSPTVLDRLSVFSSVAT